MSVYERYRVSGPETDKLQRVLDAARAWRKQAGSADHYASTGAELISSIDALDAPVERYTIIESRMENTWTHAIIDSHDRSKRAEAWCETHEAAERVSAALNAQERKP